MDAVMSEGGRREATKGEQCGNILLIFFKINMVRSFSFSIRLCTYSE